MRLLLVHGRSQGGKDPVKLKAEWHGALESGFRKAGLAMPSGIDVDFPFYGDKLDGFVRQFELPADPAMFECGAYGEGRPSIRCCRDHSAGKSARRATPMP